MRHIICLASLVCIASTGITYTEERRSTENLPTKKTGIDAKTQKILAQFANIVLGFLGIVQDPKNAANVKDRVTEMVNNAVNIVTEAVKKGQLSLEATKEEVEMFAREMIRSKKLVIE